MRQLAILTLLFVLLPALPATAAPSAPDASEEAPKAVVPEPIHDFENVPQGPELEHAYTVENQGTADLEIRRVSSDCGCTVTDFDRVIAPGESGTVRTTIDTTMISGPVSRSLTAFTNDPDNSRLRLTFKAVVEPVLYVHPGTARYAVVHGEEEPAVVRQEVFAPDGVEFTVTSVETGSPYLEAEYRRAEEGEADSAPEGTNPWIVDLRLDYNNAPVGTISEEVLIHTDHAHQDRLRVEISGFVRPALSVTPQDIDLGEVDLSDPYRFVVVVHSFRSKSVEITGVDSELGELDTNVSPVIEGHKYNITITLPPDLPEGPFDSTLVIRTSAAETAEVEVPLSGTVL